MSTTYDLVCPSLKIKLWAGQSEYLYHATESVDKMARFLHATKGHAVYFVSEHQETIITDGDIFECNYFEGMEI